MIQYALACQQAHEFESWFPSSEAYESQRKRGFVTCPVCNSGKVEKQIMAPAVGRKEKSEIQVAPKDPQPMAIISDKEREMRAMLRALREHVTRTAEHVGDRFAEEARKIHYGEADQRSIYGETNPVEAKALIEEGIDVLPLPLVPDDRN